MKEKSPKKSLGEMTFGEVFDVFMYAFGGPFSASMRFLTDIKPIFEKYEFNYEEQRRVMNVCIEILTKKYRLTHKYDED